MLLQIEDFAWDQQGIFSSFSAYEPLRNTNVVKFYEFCDPLCGQDCTNFPSPISKYCLSCVPGFTSTPSGNCEKVCLVGTYQNVDYTNCISCPACCPLCGFVPAATSPYVPNVADLQCQSPLHSDFVFVMGDCQVRNFQIWFSLDQNKTELTLTFEKEPITFDITTNVVVKTSSSWGQGTDYKLELKSPNPDPLVRVLVFQYL